MEFNPSFFGGLVSTLRNVAAAFSIGCLLCAPAGAATPYALYDNGSPVIGTGYNTGLHWLANDFTLDYPVSMLTLRLFMTYETPRDLDQVVWVIYTDDEGKPGTLVSGATAAGTRTLLGSESIFSTYQVDLTLPEILTLDPGRYWLAVHTLGDIYVYWTDASPNGTLQKLILESGASAWQPAGTESAFQIIGVPEPAQGLLLGLGLATLFLLRRPGRFS